MDTSTAMAATTTNVAIIQKAYFDFQNGNISAIIDVCADEVIWGGYRAPEIRPSGLYYGKEGVQEFFSLLDRNIRYTDFEPKQFIAQDDDVVVLGHHTGLVKETGKSFDHDWCMHFRMSDGKIRRFFAYVDTREQAQAFL